VSPGCRSDQALADGRPRPARLTTTMLMLYFTLAAGFHIEAGAKSVFGGMAAGLMVLFAAMT
jgi:hypothetical protein